MIILILLVSVIKSEATTVIKTNLNSETFLILFALFLSSLSHVNAQCDGIYGGDWVLVRHSYNKWHTSTDNLAGTDVYGTYDNNVTSTNAWSIQYDGVLETNGSNVFMFGNGNCSQYLITTNDQWSTYYANEDKYIIASHYDSDYYAKWYNRAGNPEDPWISWQDHSVNSSILYGENGYNLGNNYMGYHNAWLS